MLSSYGKTTMHNITLQEHELAKKKLERLEKQVAIARERVDVTWKQYTCKEHEMVDTEIIFHTCVDKCVKCGVEFSY